jgi:hypothetical protein
MGILGLALAEPAPAQPIGSVRFDRGRAAPESWRLSGGRGRWVEGAGLEITGDGNDSNYWRSQSYRPAPGGLYHFQMLARRVSGEGSVMAGPACANRDYQGIAGEWDWHGHVFRAPDQLDEDYLRLGQWHSAGTLQFQAVRLLACLPVYRSVGKTVLGDGESIAGNRYAFDGTFSHEGSNFHRPLASATAGFNSDRWCFWGPEQQVTYRFFVPGCPIQSARVSFAVCWHERGTCVAEVSRDRKRWLPLASREKVGDAAADVPAGLLPARGLFVRLHPAGPGGSFQVNRLEFQAVVAGEPPQGRGQTWFADLDRPEAVRLLERITLDEEPESGRAVLRVTVKNPGRSAASVALRAQVKPAESAAAPAEPQQAEIEPGQSASIAAVLPAGKPGRQTVRLELDVPGAKPVRALLARVVPEYYRSDYGQRIAGTSDDPAVWWCDATHKIPRGRPVPTDAGDCARLSAAGNDWEAVQVVVRAARPLAGLSAEATGLAGPGGASIPAGRVKILRVYYHLVEHPTDATGVRDWWPDALPPLAGPIDVAPGTNQPLWVLVHVPAGAKPGDYAGSIRLRAAGWSADVPLRLHVWGFSLPETNHLETALGYSPEEIFRYHNLRTEADRRRVLDLYLQSFAEHRISPYAPAPLDRIGVKFLPEANPPRAELDFSGFDRAMTRAIEKYNFTNFQIPLEAMGGGTFQDRYPPQIGKYGENTPQYQGAVASYLKQLEEHLRAKGWLRMAYTYWFDEPAAKDYAFVRAGMQRIHRFAPGIQRMLTVQPVDDLAGAVDIWSPVTPNYDHARAERRRAQGERLWWYVCCGPKAPYCTLFIDHPATELRVWLWQTWQRNVAGILVWSTNYWTSTAAYPEQPQNPYLDPMGYVSGYSTPAGTKQYWGNGDGRFLYPPEAAAVPGQAGSGPVREGPVSSIRWEMLREGIEDYEMLCLLRARLAGKRASLPAEEVRRLESLLEVPAAITKDMTTFTTDPAPIYARRAQIAEAVERLGP